MSIHINILRAFALLLWSLSLVLSHSSPSFAALSLSANPLTGGTSLRFGRVDVVEISSKEVRMRISASDNEQYQVFQRFVEPLVNERGRSLDQEALQAYTLSGSNAQGTLYQQDIQGVSFADSLIYTSNSEGLSDSFTIVYQINNDRVNTTGTFTGRLLYSVRPIGSATQQDVVLTVYLEIPDELQVTTEGSSGLDAVRLGTGPQGRQKGHFKLSIEGNLGGEIKVYQQMNDLPQNEFFEAIEREAVFLSTAVSGSGQSYFPDPQSLTPGRKLLFSSRDDNENLLINYELNPEIIKDHKAGTYRGPIDFWIEGDADQQLVQADLEVEVLPVFELETEFPQGRVHFSNVLPNSPPQMSEVKVVINSNLGKPYIITQSINAPLTNEKGEKMDGGLFTIKQKLDDGNGKIQFPEFAPVQVGDVPLYYSDGNGSSAEFKILYRIKPDAKMKAGDYSTGIVLTLGEV